MTLIEDIENKKLDYENDKLDFNQLLTAVCRATIDEVLEMLPPVNGGMNPRTGMQYYLQFNKGKVKGFNDYRTRARKILKTLRKELYVQTVL